MVQSEVCNHYPHGHCKSLSSMSKNKCTKSHDDVKCDVSSCRCNCGKWSGPLDHEDVLLTVNIFLSYPEYEVQLLRKFELVFV